MNKFLILSVILVSIGISPVMAADPTPTPPPNLTPGSYTVNVMPPFNHDVAVHIEDAIGKVDGLKSVDAHTQESTIRFTVKNDAQVTIDQLRRVLNSVDSDAVMTTPVLEHSLSTNPGL